MNRSAVLDPRGAAGVAPFVKDGVAFLHNDWTGKWLAVEHLSGRLISYDEQDLAATRRAVREQASFDPSRTRHCNGCGKDLPLTKEFWTRRRRAGFSWRCVPCCRNYTFRGLTSFMQRRILTRKQTA
jgi:hypothetical protein